VPSEYKSVAGKSPIAVIGSGEEASSILGAPQAESNRRMNVNLFMVENFHLHQKIEYP
jgi:hypothetical protein